MILNYLTEQQKQLLEFVSFHHKDQLRKYTNKPYIEHCIEVADLVFQYYKKDIIGGMIEIALCHDLIEDTKCTIEMLKDKLRELNYDSELENTIIFGVKQLTNEHTKEKYPELNRHERKMRDAQIQILSMFQSIKYADIIDNISSIALYDKEFAKVYITEKRMFIDHNRSGNVDLLIRCCYEIESALRLILIS